MSAESCLSEFLRELKENPKHRTVELDSEIIESLVTLLLDRINSRTKMYALIWLREYLEMFYKELQ